MKSWGLLSWGFGPPVGSARLHLGEVGHSVVATAAELGLDVVHHPAVIDQLSQRLGVAVVSVAARVSHSAVVVDPAVHEHARQHGGLGVFWVFQNLLNHFVGTRHQLVSLYGPLRKGVGRT